jgi:hypothetical protein
MYAKMALLMFYPFHQLNKLTCAGSYWKSFTKNYNTISTKKPQSFGKKCFNILQNIEDRSTLQAHLKRARDPIAMSTVKTKPKESTSDVPNLSRGNNDVLDILQIGIHSK